jgi:2'-5' RNA ligase
MMKYLCAITLPEDVTSVLNGLQQSYRTASWKILLPPHITILPPALALAPVEQTINFLRNVASTIHPFDIEVDGVDRFKNGSNTVYAKIKPNDDLVWLHTQLSKITPSIMAVPSNAREEFNPHITLSNKLSNTLAEQVKIQLDEQRINFVFECSSLSLFKKEMTDPKWVELQKLYFM